jgi:uridine kinase
VVSGASGSGKSAVCRALLGQVPAAVLLDSDTLWRPEFDTPANHYRDFFEFTFRDAKQHWSLEDFMTVVSLISVSG